MHYIKLSWICFGVHLRKGASHYAYLNHDRLRARQLELPAIYQVLLEFVTVNHHMSYLDFCTDIHTYNPENRQFLSRIVTA